MSSKTVVFEVASDGCGSVDCNAICVTDTA